MPIPRQGTDRQKTPRLGQCSGALIVTWPASFYFECDLTIKILLRICLKYFTANQNPLQSIGRFERSGWDRSRLFPATRRRNMPFGNLTSFGQKCNLGQLTLEHTWGQVKVWATIPFPGTSKHQKYFLQLDVWGKKPSSLHLKAVKEKYVLVEPTRWVDYARSFD